MKVYAILLSNGQYESLTQCQKETYEEAEAEARVLTQKNFDKPEVILGFYKKSHSVIEVMSAPTQMIVNVPKTEKEQLIGALEIISKEYATETERKTLKKIVDRLKSLSN